MASIPLLTIEARLKRRIRKHLRKLGFEKDEEGRLQPPENTKECFRSLHLAQRTERLEKERSFIDTNWRKLSSHFADGTEIVPEQISPRLELIQADSWQSDLFRLASLTWSIPVSQGYGRRMRFLVWDDNNGKLIGLFGLTDPVFNLKVRDEWIGWSVDDRRERLVNVMDAFVLGALPPYNLILGGKLIASLLCTCELVQAFKERYSKSCGIISQREKRPSFCLITTSSALGRSSVYNRLALGGRRIMTSVGYTSGWGHFHISDGLFTEIRNYLSEIGDDYADNHRFGDGPNWKLRAVRKTLSLLGMDPSLLQHGIAREVFVCPLASNAREVLRGVRKRPNFKDLESCDVVAEQALGRWVVPRAERRPEFRRWRRSSVEDLLATRQRGEVLSREKKARKAASEGRH